MVAMKWRAAHAIVISMTSMSGHRLFQDDLPSVSISRLRASGVVTSDTKSVDIAFGEGDDALRREVKLVAPPLSERRRMVAFSVPVCERRCAYPQAARQAACVGAAVFAKGLDIAYRAARRSSATSRGWRGFRSCASCSTAAQ